MISQPGSRVKQTVQHLILPQRLKESIYGLVEVLSCPQYLFAYAQISIY